MNTNTISEPSFLIIPVKSSIQKKAINNLRQLRFAPLLKARNCNAILSSVSHILFTLVDVVTAAIYEGITESSTIIKYMHGIQTRSYRS